MNKNLQLYNYAKSQIGRKLSPIYKDVGCVEALRNVWKGCFNEELAQTYSTHDLYQSLLSDSRFEILPAPILGCLIISPTMGDNKGHVGITSDNFRILSNNSETLFFDEHLTQIIWWERYKIKFGLPVKYFGLKVENSIKDSDNIKIKVGLLAKLAELYQLLLKQIKK